MLSSVGATVIVVSLVVVVTTLRPPVWATVSIGIADIVMIALTARSLHIAHRIELRATDEHLERSVLRASLDERSDREAHFRHLAFHDPLTGLPNRALFKDLLASAHRRACEDGYPLALMMIDVDRFKKLNDELGHRAGDAVLLVVAARIKECLRTTDYAARLGGDEFAVIIDNVEDQEEVLAVATRVQQSMENPIPVLDSEEVQVTVSTGIVVMDEPRGDPLHVLHRADLAMYDAKRNNRGGFAMWTPEVAHRLRVTPLVERRVRVGE
ncbi:MAG TPA: GGDEF domain-containing protein [Actinomycetota bacterium]|nr:GGDEF domain-containing protein [Actinomycetota bacterium]